MSLRPYQEQCIDRILIRRVEGILKMLVSKATGLGKTETFARLPERMPKGMQMVVIAHTKKLVKQAAKKIQKRNPELKVGIEMGGLYAPVESDIIVASVQTFSKSPKRMKTFAASNVYWLVIDEAHHATAKTYGKVIDYFMGGGNCALIGFTATPNRADGDGLGRVFEEIVYSYGMQEGIADGWLSDVFAFTVKTNTDISEVLKKDNEDALANEVNNPVRNELIVKNWVEYCWPRQTVGFCVNVQHAIDLAESFKRQGIRAEAVWGDDPNQAKKIGDEETGDIGMVARGEIDVILCAQLLTEGWDHPGIECVILGAPSKSQGKIVQEVGRGTRLDEAISNAGGNLKEWQRLGLVTDDMKQNLLVMDVVDIFAHHSVVTLPSLFGVNRNVEMKGQNVMGVVDTLKKAQERYPNVDFSSLQDLDKIESYAKYANIWDVKFADEMKEYSEMTWIKRGDGGFMLRLPNSEYFKITGDLTGKYTVEGEFNGKGVKLNAPSKSLEDAVRQVETRIVKDQPDLMKLLGKEQKWRKGKVTENQMIQLKKLRVPDSIIVKMNSGSASAYLSEQYAKFKQQRRTG